MARGDTGGNRLDQPVVPGRRLLRGPNVDPDAFGQATERIARFLGTGRYLVIQTVIIIVWLAINVLPGIPHFDPYQFQFLTLILSLQAAYAAPLILLAQNRQDDRDRANLVEDRQRSGRNLEDTEFLARELADIRLALGESVTRDFLRDELRDLLEELLTGDGHAGERTTAASVGPQKKKGKRKRRRAAAQAASDLPLSEPQRPEPDGEHDEEPDVEPDERPSHPAGDPAGGGVAGAAGPADGRLPQS